MTRMSQRLLVLVLLVAVGFAAYQTVATNRAIDSSLVAKSDETLNVKLSVLETPVISARRIPAFLQAPESDRVLRNELGPLVDEFPDGSCVVVIEKGRTIYDYHAERPLIPASIQKLLIAYSALDILGPEYVFTTRLVAQVLPIDGVLYGDAWVVGSGDPLLMTGSYAERFEDPFPYTDLAQLTARIEATGLKKIEGSLIGDESRFDNQRWVDTWPERFRAGEQNQSGPLGALIVNGGFQSWDPVRTSNGFSKPASEPAKHVALVLDDLLEEQGLVITGGPLVGITPQDATFQIASIDSPPLKEIVSQMLVTSDNTTAELLLKELAAIISLPGTSIGGSIAVMENLTKNGYSIEQAVINDGSGLDPGNRTTCNLVAGILDTTHDSPELVRALPISGKSGTLRKRFVDTSGEGRVRGKTGSLRDVLSLAGIVETLEGRSLTFVLITNTEAKSSQLKSLHDDVVLSLMTYPAGPPLELLAPLPASG